MSANLPPLPPGSESTSVVPAAGPGYSMQAYEPAYTGSSAGGTPDDAGALNLSRFFAALQRYRWLIAATVLLATAGGIAATRFIDPEYVVNATVFATPTAATGGTARGLSANPTLTQNQGWRDLLRSFAISDPVVMNLGLYLRPDAAKDSIFFTNFTLQTNRRFRPGDYTLETANGRYTLTDKIGFVHEEGTVGDSVGRVAGFAWVPPARLVGTRSRKIKFRVMTPREASVDVRNRFDVLIDIKSPVIYLTLKGTATQRPAATLNAMITRFVEVANELKTRELDQQSATLQTQLQSALSKLQSSERALQDYRVATISKPTEGLPTAPMQNNSQALIIDAGNSTFGSYFARKTEYELLHRDRLAIERIVQQLRAPNSTTPPDAIYAIPTVTKDEAATSVRQVIGELSAKQSELRQALLTATDANPGIIDMRRNIAELRERVLPQRLDEYLTALRTREDELNAQVASATTELKEIPSRTIQQGALQREQMVNSDIYTQLRSAYAQANLARQSAVPDVKVLDSAVTPLEPSSNTAPKIIGFAIAAGLLLGVGLAFLLDRLDNRFRYPDQAKSDLGLDVLGVVPVVAQDGRQSPEAVAQIVEGFRSIRMNVRYANAGQRSITLGITSPGPGDGKSLVASNLALSFAEGGWRTVLVDADTRRGQLNTTFDTPTAPGLIEYLEGTSLLAEVLYPTRHDNLTLIPCGTRHRRAPELLATPHMQQLIASLATEFDVVIIDTPPLGAGTDAYAIGTACGQLAVVLRSNRTNLKMAKAKLAVLAQLPVSLIGAILNEVHTDSAMYQYYSYDPEYVLPEETPALSSGSGNGTAVAVRDA